MTHTKKWGLAAAGLIIATLVVVALVVFPDRGTGAADAAPEPPSGDYGADVPFLEYQAEDASTDGEVIGPDWAYGTLASEAVGRQAVLLDQPGDHVEFTLEEPANAVNVRLSIPDSEDGTGLDDTLGIYVDGERLASLEVTSRFSWFYGVFPWSNTPSDGGPRQMFGDSRVLLGETLPAGTQVRLEIGEGDTAPWYAVDVADFEEVAPAADAPDDALSVLDFGADPTGEVDSSDAIQAAIGEASGSDRTVWLPAGTFAVTRHLIVDDVTVRGAGPWHSVLTGDGVGVYGNYNPSPSTDVHLSDFAVFGEVGERVDEDQINAIGGAMGDSSIDNVWLQNTKVGMWFDGPFDSLEITRARILSQTADGVNFHDGITNSSVTDSYIRSTGDDGLAMWSHNHPNRANTFSRNTVKVPVLANNIAIYGGEDTTVSQNWVTDTVTQGGGLHVAHRFDATALAGTTTLAGNRLDRTGSLDLFRHDGNGAILLEAVDSPMAGNLVIRDNDVNDSAYSSMQVLGEEITNVTVEGNSFDGAGTHALQLDGPGSATFADNTASSFGGIGVRDCDSGFTVTDGGGNEGWESTGCEPVAPGPLDVSDLGKELHFRSGGVGESSPPQTVTVHNGSSTAVPIASITATGSYLVDENCGEQIAPATSCEITLVFAPTENGDLWGTLTVSDGTSAGRYQLYLRGEVEG